MPQPKPWEGIPEIQHVEMSPKALAHTLAFLTGRSLRMREFDEFRVEMLDGAKTPEELLPWAHLTTLYPHCIAAVLDGSEKVSETGKLPLLLLARTFPGCDHCLLALYDWHPVRENVWNDALHDHIRIWTWKRCEICEANKMRPM